MIIYIYRLKVKAFNLFHTYQDGFEISLWWFNIIVNYENNVNEVESEINLNNLRLNPAYIKWKKQRDNKIKACEELFKSKLQGYQPNKGKLRNPKGIRSGVLKKGK